MTTEVFGSDEPQSQTPTGTLETLVGEGKKYKTVEDLAKAYQHADTTIASRTRELQEMREELNLRLDTEEVLKRARANPEPVDNAPQGKQPAVAATPLSNEDLAARIREVTQADQAAANYRANVENVAVKLVEIYGTEAQANEAVKKRADELGVSIKYLQDAAATSPKAFFVQMGLEASPKPVNPAPARSDVNPTAFSNNSGAAKPGTYLWYENLRKTDAKKYFSREVQLQIHRDAAAAQARGEQFFP